MLSLSTALKSEISDSGEGIIREILSYGIRAVELEYRITETMLKEILPFVKKRDILVNSIHNIMPLPDGMSRETANGEFVSLSSPERSEREMAVKYTRRTLEWAEETGAQAVVLHMGKVLMESPMRALRDLYDRKKIATDEGRAVLAEKMELRRRKEEGKYLTSALQSLEKLALEAERKRVFLGIENRYNLQDFPNLEELRVIFKEFKGSPVRYWHDLGHATTQENLGMVEKGQLLDLFGRHLIGVHLHGCRGYEDHAAPGSGEEDYSQLKKYLKADTVKVVETHYRATREELQKGLEFLRSQGIE
jgi:sugar phosphate isomerase/epimerase